MLFSVNTTKKVQHAKLDVHAEQHFLIPNRFEKGQIPGIWYRNANSTTLSSTLEPALPYF